MRVGIVGSVLFSTVFLIGCVSYPDYPDRWAEPLKAPDACAALSGAYADLGGHGNDDEYTGKRKPRLRGYLFENAQELDDLDRIEIEFGPDRILRMRAVKDGGVVATTEYSEKASTLNCRGDAAEIDVYRGITRDAGNPIVGIQNESTYLLKAEDGALVVKSSGSAVGLAYLFFPVAAGGHYWYRFPAID